MNAYSLPGSRYAPRSQAARISAVLAEQEFGFRGALLGKRREGKTDLLRQIRFLLFEKAAGPIPFLYVFPAGRKDAALARHFVAAFCLQMRAFLVRQEDLLAEPPASVEQELGKAGLPLSVAEMATNLLALPPEHQLDFAATLPAQFANRENRLLCLLWDDIQTLDTASAFFAALDSPNLSWLLSGRYPSVLQLAGRAGWPLVRLESFSAEEALAVARKQCQALGVQFSRQLWELWCEMSGTSPWLISCLIIAAAVRNLPLSSIEDLGRIYIEELSSGALGNCLSARFEQAVPGRLDRAAVREYLSESAKAEVPHAASVLPQHVWDGLVAEEWAEEDVAGPCIIFDSLRRDWISLATAGSRYERAKARMLETFLLRADRRKEHPGIARFSTVIRQRLLDLPQSGFPEFFSWEDQEFRFPKIVSVCAERVAGAELFWCYGFYEENRESPAVLLIAICDETPADAQLEKWSRQLDAEASSVQSAQSGTPLGGTGVLPLVWVAVPPGTSLNPSGSERRFSWESFFRLVVKVGTSEPKPVPRLEK